MGSLGVPGVGVVVDMEKWEKRLRQHGWHKTPRGLVAPKYYVTIDSREVDEFVEYLFIRAMYSYATAANTLGVDIRDISKKPRHGKSSQLHREAYKIFVSTFGHIYLKIKGAKPTSKYYKYGLILSDGSIVSQKTLKFDSSKRELIAIVLETFKRTKIYIGYPVLLDKGIIHPFIRVLIKNDYGTKESILRELERATLTQLFDYIARLVDGDGTIHERNGIRISVGWKKLDAIKPIEWMGKLHRDGRYTYKFSIYKDFQKAILPRMKYVQKREKLEAVLQKGYRKHEFDGIRIAITLRGNKPRIEFYGNIKKS